MQTIALLLLLIILNVLADPKPSGGANCTNNIDCGGVNAGLCINITDGIGHCMCPANLGNPDCSYDRMSKNFAGGINLLFIIGIGGVGDFVLGNTGIAVAQLILLLSSFCVCVAACVFLCTFCCCKPSFEFGGVFGGIVGMVVCLSTTAGLALAIYRTVVIWNGTAFDGNGYSTY